MKRHNDHKLSEILSELVETPRIRKGYYNVSIEEAWHDIMGKSISSYTQSLKFNNGNLTIFITSAPLKHELSLGKEKLINLLNQKIGKKVITNINIK